MSERERRQRRLLHVRSLQADLAAAQLRLLRFEQDEDTRRLQLLEKRLHTAVPAVAADWLVTCAERELAVLQADWLMQRVEERAPRVQAEAVEEQRRRQEREQVKHLCERTAAQAQKSRERADQAMLDELYCAARAGMLTRRLSQSRSGKPES